MVESLRVVLYTLFLVFIRKKVLGILFIILTVPVAIEASYTLVTNTLVEETIYMYKSIERGKGLLIITNTPEENTNCTDTHLYYSKIVFKNNTITAPIITMNKETYIEVTKYWPRKALENNKTIYVSIPSIYKVIYGLKPGEKIHICQGNTCRVETIDLIHIGKGALGSSIIIVTTNKSINYMGKEYCIAKIGNNLLEEKIANPLIKSLSGIQAETTILLTLAYFPIMLLGFKKIKKYTSREYNILYELGVSEKTLRTGIVSILAVLGIIICLYGVFLATLLTHLSLWILRLYGIIIVSRPLPDPISLSPYIALLLSLYCVAAIIVFTRREDERT